MTRAVREAQPAAEMDEQQDSCSPAGKSTGRGERDGEEEGEDHLHHLEENEEEEDEDEQDVGENKPKRRGPKKKKMTKARMQRYGSIQTLFHRPLKYICSNLKYL